MAGYDYIVVGSGSAGGFVTWKLSENPDARILLLEAGPTDRHWTTRIPAAARYTFESSQHNWLFQGEPEPHLDGRRLDQPRGKVIGGSSSLNGMVWVRGHPADYDDWVAAGADGWSWDDVLPHYKAIETYSDAEAETRGHAGPVEVQRLTDNHPIEDAFVAAGAEAGHAVPADYNSGQGQEGVTVFDANTARGWRSGTARACVWPAAKRPNVTVLTGAQVMRINFEGTRAVSVTYRRDNHVETVHADAEIVLSAGAFQTPQVLMLSGIGPADHLNEHGLPVLVGNDAVGANLQDHLECHIKFHCPHRGMTKNKLVAPHRIALAGIEWALFRTGPASTVHSRTGAFFRSSPDQAQPDIQFHFWPYFMDGWSPPPDRDGFCFDVGPTKSESRGRVWLGSANPFAAPKMVLNGLSTEKDRTDFRKAIAIAREICAQPSFDFCRGAEMSPGADITSDADLDAYVRQNANSAYHPCGTAAMGTVCDAEGRVMGVEGLRVADASLIPRITNGNINAPSMMIGHKIATHMMDAA